jgi:hypothetical protein
MNSIKDTNEITDESWDFVRNAKRKWADRGHFMDGCRGDRGAVFPGQDFEFFYGFAL